MAVIAIAQAHSTAGGEGLQPADIFAISIPRAPAASPDGRSIAYIREGPDAQADAVVRVLHIRTADGADCAIDTQKDVRFALWAPDGSLIVVATDADDEKRSVVRRLSKTGAGAVTLATLAGAPSKVAIAPDGKRLAFTMTVPEPRRRVTLPEPPVGASWGDRARYIDRTVWRIDGVGEIEGDDQIFALDLATGEAEQLTTGSLPGGIYPSGIAWSADGDSILFSSNLRPDWERQQFNSEIYAIDVGSKKIDRLTDRFGPDFDPKLSPDGEWIAYRGFDDDARPFSGTISLYVMHADGSGAQKLADVGEAIGTHAWAADAQGLFFSYVRGGRARLAHVDLAGKVRELADDLAAGDGFDVEPYLSGNAELATTRAGVIATVSSPTDPGHLVLISTSGRRSDLTPPDAGAFGRAGLGRPEELRYGAPDGTPLQGWLLLPPGYDPARRYPMILDIHGGPDLAYGPQFSFRFQRYAANGYIVFLPNYRGSAGGDMRYYDRPWQFPVPEYDDLMSGVDAAMAKVSVDPARLFVTGLSAGGILTAWTIGKTDRFAAAVVQSPIINFVSHSLTQDLYSSYVEREFEKMPWEDPMSYWKRSPLSLVGNVTTPTLVIQGERDSRTPSSEGIQFYQALKLRGVAAALLLLPDSFHIPRRPSQLIEEQQFILDWFERHPRR